MNDVGPLRDWPARGNGAAAAQRRSPRTMRCNATATKMKLTYFVEDDVLELRLTDGRVEREVSQDWHTHVSYAKDGSLVQLVFLEARQRGLYPVEVEEQAGR